jgi:hypothetical protein
MSEEIERPLSLQVNAWTGDFSPTQTLPARTPWAQKEKFDRQARWLAPAAPVDPRDWAHPDIGWGLVLPDKDCASPAELARGDDAPTAIQKLLRARKDPPVLRFRASLQQGYLRRYYPDRPAQDLSTSAPRLGSGESKIPQYLLIYATPEEVPWAVQYALNMSTFVGRLDLAGEALENYVEALLTDWATSRPDPRRPVVWSTDYGSGDITWLMARAVADKLWEKYSADTDLRGGRRLTGPAATADALGTALAELSPALIVTTSHGMTGPVADAALLKTQLGSPVDALHKPLAPDRLSGWDPGGAIWYAHACCSAGSDSVSRYDDLLPAEGRVGSMLRNVAGAAGAMVAPLARSLLGGARPLRAFVGHVEPTFDWTLRDPANKQVVTQTIQAALYDRLCQADRRTPIGFALQDIYKEAGNFYGAWQDAIRQINSNVPRARDWALYRQLVAMDRQTLVILGDPTVALPALSTQK